MANSWFVIGGEHTAHRRSICMNMHVRIIMFEQMRQLGKIQLSSGKTQLTSEYYI